MMYCEWYRACDFVVLLAVEVCVDNGGVNVFYVCLNFVVVYCVVGSLFLMPGCCLLCYDVV